MNVGRWRSRDEMMREINGSPNCNVYRSSLLDDYADFIEVYMIPVSIDEFVSQYWNIITVKDFLKLKEGDKIYWQYETNALIVENVYEDEQEVMIVECFEDITDSGGNYIGQTFFLEAGTVYGDKFSNFNAPVIKEKERMVKESCQKLQTVLITKTSHPLS